MYVSITNCCFIAQHQFWVCAALYVCVCVCTVCVCVCMFVCACVVVYVCMWEY